MKIFVHESVSGGGFSERPLPASMAGEGFSMLRAILEDFQALGGHEIRSTLDARLPVPTGLPVTMVTRGRYDEVRAALLDWAEAVLLIAPETDGVLERLSAEVEAAGKHLLGSSSQAVAAAGDKSTSHSRLDTVGLPTPRTCAIRWDDDPTRALKSFGFPAVVKPVDGAGSVGISIIRRPAEITPALRRLARATRRESFLVQEYVPGTAASLCCLSDGVCVLPLTLNTQYISGGGGSGLAYRGGTVHIDHPGRATVFELARRLPRAFPGLRGYFGVDLVLTRSGPVFIEVNPRLTTSYIGLRRAVSANLAAAIMTSALGGLPSLPAPGGPVRFFTGRRPGTGGTRR